MKVRVGGLQADLLFQDYTGKGDESPGAVPVWECAIPVVNTGKQRINYE
jgi:hypothetical protein